MIVVAIIGLLSSIAVPNFLRARDTAQRNTCITNLKQINGAKVSWAMENRKQGTEVPGATDLWGAYSAYIRDTPACPGHGTYTIGNVTEKAICNLSASDGHSL